MAVKIRLARRGRKKLATYDVIVADARSPRDGRIIEKLGTYNPLTNPATIVINDNKTLDWLLKGAQPTDTARRILSHRGILLKKHLQIGVLKEAITQEQADKKFADWQEAKEAEISGTIDSLAKIKADEAKARLDAEKKVNEAKAEALKKKIAALVPVEEAPAEEEVAVAEEAKAQTEEEAIPTEEPKVEDSDKKAEPAPVEEKVEEVKIEATEEPKAESNEAPAEEKEDTPAKESEAVDTKVEETKEEAKADEVKAPVAKEEAKAEEKKEEDKK